MIEFHAISCAAHNWICQHEIIRGLPVLRAHEPDSSDYKLIESFTPSDIAAAFGLSLESKVENKQMFDVMDMHTYEEGFFDILGAAMDIYRRTKSDVFRDATVSLLYAFEFDIDVFDEDNIARKMEVFSG
jgi:hypothetical protein